MSAYPQMVKVKKPSSKKNKFDLSCQHITTANFMQFHPVYARELVPGQKIEINANMFARFEPLVQPTFGMSTTHLRAFFVPFRQVCPWFNEMISRTNFVGITTHRPRKITTVTIPTICAALKHADVSSTQPVAGQTGQVFDINFGSEQVPDKRYLRPLGRHAMKLLMSLGYRIPLASKESVSSLPLLSVAKIYLDWYYQNQYTDVDAVYNRVARLFKKNDEDSAITVDDLVDIFKLTHSVCYDSSYFVSAWDNPISPNTLSSHILSDTVIKDITMMELESKPEIQLTGQDTPFITQDADARRLAISQYITDSLKAISDYVKRHQLVGTRTLDNYLAQYGINLTIERLNRAYYIGHKDFQTQIGDVVSTADTEGASLGSYSGKAVTSGSDGNTFNFTSDEYGYFVIVSTVIPRVMYAQGMSRDLLHIKPLDFFTPDFDALGVQAISSAEVFTPLVGAKNVAGQMVSYDDSYLKRVFGYVPRFAEYKVGQDNVTGDLTLGSTMLGKDSWHLMRTFDIDSFSGDPRKVVHSSNFIKGLDKQQYNRLFFSKNDNYDKIYQIYSFDVTSYMPAKSLYDDYDIGSDDDTIMLDGNASKFN